MLIALLMVVKCILTYSNNKGATDQISKDSLKQTTFPTVNMP